MGGETCTSGSSVETGDLSTASKSSRSHVDADANLTARSLVLSTTS
eukprot:CAMPEP_0178444208 /NCGR_PEP_ID=MMETSP0689_2-20121128/39358_1 /TAXON_ID=160604 /ORGANISM="Amphidinium massartii, Strain CS-259" /LENGTH=45 /DNA_ID= /DNA_START= /DNA_END= /DNA_ORIENTATION=